jgi:rod shape-determining protein MreC
VRAAGDRATRVTLPFKVVGQRFTLIFLLTLSLAFLVLGKANPPLMEGLRTNVIEGAAPVLEVLSRPVSALNYMVTEGQGLFFLHDENQRLKEENARLLHWQTVARRLEQESAEFRELLNVRGDPKSSFASARVIGDTGGPFVHTLLVNAGRKDGILKGQAVVNGEGLIGRVVETASGSSRVLLLTDLNSRVPVLVESSRHRAALTGDNTDFPQLSFLPLNAKVAAGDRIITSGHGGLLPPGLPVGVVRSVEGGVVRVQPFVDRNRVEFVSAINFNMPHPFTEGDKP